MNDQFELKMSNAIVGKLRNIPAITRVSRLSLEHIDSQLDSPCINQRPLKFWTITGYPWTDNKKLDRHRKSQNHE